MRHPFWGIVQQNSLGGNQMEDTWKAIYRIYKDGKLVQTLTNEWTYKMPSEWFYGLKYHAYQLSSEAIIPNFECCFGVELDKDVEVEIEYIVPNSMMLKGERKK